MTERTIAITLAAVVAMSTAALADAAPAAAESRVSDAVGMLVAHNPVTRASATSLRLPPGVHLDPGHDQCTPYGEPSYAYACPCAYGYGDEDPYSYGYYACAPFARSGIPAPTARRSGSGIGAPETVVAEPASLPLTGENVLLVTVLGAGLASGGVVLRRRIASR